MIYYKNFVYVVKSISLLHRHQCIVIAEAFHFSSVSFSIFCTFHLWRISNIMSAVCVCVCFFQLDTASRSTLLPQLKIIYFRVHWVSYQGKRYSYFQCACAGHFFFSFILWQFGSGAKMMLKDTCTDTSKNVLAFLMEKLWPSFFGNVDSHYPSTATVCVCVFFFSII